MTEPITCRIDFNVNDRRRAIKALVDRVSQCGDLSAIDGLVFDLKKCQYLGPDGAALLAAIILDLRHRGCDVHVIEPAGPPRLRAFFRHSGLKAIAENKDVDESVQSGEDQPVMPLRQIHTASFQDADPIIRMLQRYGTAVPEFDEYLRICVNEVIQNIQDHADSPIGGVMTARFMTKDREVRVAIVDRGLGVCTTLRRRWPDTTAQNVLPRVLLEGEYSARSRQNNLGLGLSNLTRIIKHRKGDLFIFSENSAAEIRARGDDWFGKLAPGYVGTGVFFTLPVGE